MSILTHKTVGVGCLCFISLLFAGTMDNPVAFSGLWGGVGAGYINTTINGKTNITMVQSSSSPATFLLNNNQENHFSPMANIGVFFDLRKQWVLGAKAVYKYLGTEQYEQSWAGTFIDGTNETAGLHTKLGQEFFLLLNSGYQFGDWLVYGGIGPSIIRVDEILNGDLLPATSSTFQPANLSSTKTILGGAGQIGFEYMLPNRFMVDISYNLLASGNTSIPAILFQTGTPGAYTSFHQSVQVVEQGINISINKYFM